MGRRAWLAAWLTVTVFAGPARTESAWYDDYHSARRIYAEAPGPEDLHVAMSLVRRALAKRPPARRVGEVEFLRGQVAYDLGDAEVAIDALQSAVSAEPNTPQYWLWLGYAYDLDGRTTFAVRALRRVYRHPLATEQERASAAEWLESLHEPPSLAKLEPGYSLVVPGAVISYHPGEPFVADVRDALVGARQRILELLGFEVEQPVEVILFHDESEYRAYHEYRRLPRPEWSTACTVNGRIFTYPVTGQVDALLDTLIHEYTHVALRAYAQDRTIPCWLDEGMAVVMARQFPNYRRDIARAPELLTLSALMVPSFGVYDRHYAYVAYSQSKAMTEDLLQLYGDAELRAFLQLLGRGLEAPAAFTAAFGVSLEAFYQWWLTERADGG